MKRFGVFCDCLDALSWIFYYQVSKYTQKKVNQRTNFLHSLKSCFCEIMSIFRLSTRTNVHLEILQCFVIFSSDQLRSKCTTKDQESGLFWAFTSSSSHLYLWPVAEKIKSLGHTKINLGRFRGPRTRLFVDEGLHGLQSLGFDFA